MHVRTPTGDIYEVGIQRPPGSRLSVDFADWRKRRRMAKAGKAGWTDNPGMLIDNGSGAALLFMVVVKFPAIIEGLFTGIVVPIFLLVLDLLLTVMLVPIGLFARVVLRKPWTVLVFRADTVTVADQPPEAEIQVTGWFRALRTRDSIAEALISGSSLTTATSTAPA